MRPRQRAGVAPEGTSTGETVVAGRGTGRSLPARARCVVLRVSGAPQEVAQGCLKKRAALDPIGHLSTKAEAPAAGSGWDYSLQDAFCFEKGDFGALANPVRCRLSPPLALAIRVAAQEQLLAVRMRRTRAGKRRMSRADNSASRGYAERRDRGPLHRSPLASAQKVPSTNAAGSRDFYFW